jgi:hypothetical protein
MRTLIGKRFLSWQLEYWKKERLSVERMQILANGVATDAAVRKEMFIFLLRARLDATEYRNKCDDIMIIFDIFFCAAMFGQPPHSDNLS